MSLVLVAIFAVFVAMFVVFWSTFWLVVNNWLPFTASVEVADTSPALTLVNVVPLAPAKVTLSLTAASSYFTAALSLAACCAANASNWPLFTASLVLVPASTPLIWLVVLSITTLPTVTLSAVTPALLITVFPVVTLVKFKFLLNANATLLFVLVAVKLVSAGSTTPISTVSPALIAPLLAPLVWRLKPPFKVVMSLVFVAILLVLVVMFAVLVAISVVFWATLLLVVVNWPKFTASPGALPSATLLITVFAALMPVVVTLGPPVITKPFVSNLLLPAVTLSTVKSFDVATVMSLPLRVISMLSPSINCTVSLDATALAVSPFTCSLNVWPCKLLISLVLVAMLLVFVVMLLVLVVMFAVLVAISVVFWATLLLVVVNWPKLTASFGALPSATLVMTLLPASMPAVVMLGPPAIVRPLLSSLLLPVVTLSNVTESVVATTISAPERVILIFLPSLNFTSTSLPIVVAVSELVFNFHVWFSKLVVRLSILLIAPATVVWVVPPTL